MPDPTPNPVPRTNALPKFLQISETLLREVQAGLRPDGARLPPERELAVELGVAVGTLRKALAELEAQGVLERIQGSGNYIRAAAQTSAIYRFFRLERRVGGGLPTADLLSVDLVSKPEGAPLFGPSSQAWRMKRRRDLSGTPAAVEEIFLDHSMADTMPADAISESLYLHYRTELNLVILRVEDRVGVASPPDWAARHFALPKVCGFVERLSWDQTNTAIEYSRTWFDPEQVRYVARW